MEKFELQKPVSQLLNALKSHFFCVNFFQIDCSKQLKKSYSMMSAKSFLWHHHFGTFAKCIKRILFGPLYLEYMILLHTRTLVLLAGFKFKFCWKTLNFFIRPWKVLEFRERENLTERALSYFGVLYLFLTWNAIISVDQVVHLDVCVCQTSGVTQICLLMCTTHYSITQ